MLTESLGMQSLSGQPIRLSRMGLFDWWCILRNNTQTNPQRSSSSVPCFTLTFMPLENFAWIFCRTDGVQHMMLRQFWQAFKGGNELGDRRSMKTFWHSAVSWTIQIPAPQPTSKPPTSTKIIEGSTTKRSGRRWRRAGRIRLWMHFRSNIYSTGVWGFHMHYQVLILVGFGVSGGSWCVLLPSGAEIQGVGIASEVASSM